MRILRYRKNPRTIRESVKQARQYVESGKLDQKTLANLIEFDPSKTNKYVGWMAKQVTKNNITDMEDLRNKIEEFHTFLEKGKAKTKDINQFKTFEDLKKEVDYLNQSGEGTSVKDLESEYDVVINNSDLYIASPHTHEASRKLGLSQFAFRDCGDGGKDSTWCTTYKSPDHFNSYYFKNNVTFYYIKVKSDNLIERLKEEFPKRWRNLIVTALAVLEDGEIDGYDGLDRQMNKSEIDKFTEIIGIS